MQAASHFVDQFPSTFKPEDNRIIYQSFLIGKKIEQIITEQKNIIIDDLSVQYFQKLKNPALIKLYKKHNYPIRFAIIGSLQSDGRLLIMYQPTLPSTATEAELKAFNDLYKDYHFGERKSDVDELLKTDMHIILAPDTPGIVHQNTITFREKVHMIYQTPYPKLGPKAACSSCEIGLSCTISANINPKNTSDVEFFGIQYLGRSTVNYTVHEINPDVGVLYLLNDEQKMQQSTSNQNLVARPKHTTTFDMRRSLPYSWLKILASTLNDQFKLHHLYLGQHTPDDDKGSKLIQQKITTWENLDNKNSTKDYNDKNYIRTKLQMLLFYFIAFEEITIEQRLSSHQFWDKRTDFEIIIRLFEIAKKYNITLNTNNTLPSPPNPLPQENKTPLMYAVIKGDPDITEFLINIASPGSKKKYGENHIPPNINDKDKSGETALDHALKNVIKSPDPVKKRKAQRIVKLLVDAKANITEDKQNIILHICAEDTKALIQEHKRGVRDGDGDGYGYNPLIIALINQESVQNLLDYNADPSMVASIGSDCAAVQKAIDKKESGISAEEMNDIWGYPPLLIATRYRQHINIQALIKAKADPHQAIMSTTRKNGITALYIAASNEDHQTMKVLIAAKADVNHTIAGCSQLYIAASNKDHKTMNALIAAKAEINHAIDGFSQLVIAVQNENWDAVTYLLDKKADPTLIVTNPTSELNGISPLRLAIKNKGPLSIIQSLIEKKSSINEPICESLKQITALSIAAGQGRLDVVTYLLNKKADFNLTGQLSSMDPLLLAIKFHGLCDQNNVNIIRALLEAKDNPNKKDPSGDTLISIAMRKNSQSIIDILIEFKATLQTPILLSNAKDILLKAPKPIDLKQLSIDQLVSLKSNPRYCTVSACEMLANEILQRIHHDSSLLNYWDQFKATFNQSTEKELYNKITELEKLHVVSPNF